MVPHSGLNLLIINKVKHFSLKKKKVVEEESILTPGTVHAQRPVTLLRPEMKKHCRIPQMDVILCATYTQSERGREMKRQATDWETI